MANAILTQLGTPKKFGPSGTGQDVLFTPTNVANGAGRVSAQLDLGAAPRPQWYRWTAKTRPTSAPSVGTVVRMYLFVGDNASTARQAGTVGTADAGVAAETLFYNASHILEQLVVDASSNTKDFQASGLVRIVARYVSVGWFNAMGVAFSATDADHEFVLTPVYEEIQ